MEDDGAQISEEVEAFLELDRIKTSIVQLAYDVHRLALSNKQITKEEAREEVAQYANYLGVGVEWVDEEDDEVLP